MPKTNLLNKIKTKLNKNKVSIGSWIQIPSCESAEILSNSGYDWLAVDLEHAPININQLTNLCRTIELGSSLPIARIAESTSRNCMEVLDCGFLGIILPNIVDNDIFNDLVDSCFYPPYGKRGVGFCRSNLYGKNIEDIKSTKEFPLIVAQIENVKAIKDLDKICKNKKLSSIFIGPYDLSASLGMPGEFDNLEYKKTENEIIKTAMKNNIPYGKHITIPDVKLLKKTINQGYQFIAYSTDAYFLNYFSQNPLK